MTVRIYASTDASAPVLSGSAGALNTVLNACLVTGYGAKAGAGWTRPFTDAPSNTASYTQSGANAVTLQIADGGPGAGTFKEARARGYGTMTTALAGTEPFPTAAQRAAGQFIRKSNTADATARPWWLYADEKRFHLLTNTGDIANGFSFFSFGRYRSYKAGDTHNNYITGRNVENSATFNISDEPLNVIAHNHTNLTYIYFKRANSEVIGAVQGGLTADSTKAQQTASYIAGAVGMTYPHPVNGGLFMSKLFTHEPSILRGDIPGIWVPLHNRPILDQDTWTATIGLVARSFIARWWGASGEIIIETSDTWDL